MRHLLIAASLFVGIGMAQQTSIPEGKEFTLLPIPEKILNGMKAEGSGTACSPYFYMGGTDRRPNAEGKYTVTMFGYMDEGGLHMNLVGLDKFVVIVDKTKSVPTANYSVKYGRENTVPFHWIVKISPADLAKAQKCLPDPAK